MYDSYLTFSSLTAAQRGLELCRFSNIPVQLTRIPQELAVYGCGYGLNIPWSYCHRAAIELRISGCTFGHAFRKRLGAWEEVWL